MKKNTIKKVFAGILSILIMFLFVLPLTINNVLAETEAVSNTYLWDNVKEGLEDTSLNKSLPNIITGIINIIMGTLGVIVVLIILWGGFIWMTAGGEADKVDKAKKMIYSGIIGLIIILASYAIATFVLNALGSIGAE